VPDFDLLR